MLIMFRQALFRYLTDHLPSGRGGNHGCDEGMGQPSALLCNLASLHGLTDSSERLKLKRQQFFCPILKAAQGPC